MPHSDVVGIVILLTADSGLVAVKMTAGRPTGIRCDIVVTTHRLHSILRRYVPLMFPGKVKQFHGLTNSNS